MLYSSDKVEAVMFAQYLQDWANSNSNAILIDQTDTVLTLNSKCPVVLNSSNDPLCSIASSSPSVIPTPDNSEFTHTVGILILSSACVGGFLILTITGCFVVLLVCIVRKRTKKQ